MASLIKNEKLEDERQILERIEELLKLIAKTLLSDRIDAILGNKSHRILYEETGVTPVKQLAKKTGLSTGAISLLWQKWEKLGLLIKDGKHYSKVL